jgi:dephospho-CoA kinase
LTGGIASGKTAVSDHFARLGVPVVDTDRIAHDMVEPGQPALQRIADSFGPGILDCGGALDRRKMRKLIFSDPVLKSRLENILHPLISEEVLRQIGRQTGPYCILVIPLFAESSSYTWIDRVLVVDVPEEVQIKRVMARDQIEWEQAEAILQAQTGRHKRLALADDVLDNSGSFSELKKRVEKLHRFYLETAGSGSGSR